MNGKTYTTYKDYEMSNVGDDEYFVSAVYDAKQYSLENRLRDKKSGAKVVDINSYVIVLRKRIKEEV